ncbi:MAG: 2-dehydropantoate 2-reductase [Verrucomicrobiae bacterium]|nr:2-dehydropantoate 2-reductase [Verrucomicrobiae bacterium]
MKIAIVGCGALGSYYGACLWRQGYETYFLLRSDYEAVRDQGVLVESDAGTFRARPRAAFAPEDIGPSDLVIVALKTTANGRFPDLLPPLVGPRTAVLTLQNGLGNEEALAALLPPAQVLGGLCFVCLNRDAPGVIRHIAHGRILLGEFGRPAEPRTHEIARVFRSSGIPCDVTDQLAKAHWEKLIWNIPFNGLGVASAAGREAWETPELPPVTARHPNLTTDRLLADPWWTALVRELMQEVIATARALGHAIPDAQAEGEIRRTQDMGPYRASTLVDFALGRPLELDSLFLEPLRQAVAAGVPVPRLRRLCAVLEALGDSPPGLEAPSGLPNPPV